MVLKTPFIVTWRPWRSHRFTETDNLSHPEQALDPPPYLVPHSQEAIRILYRDADLLVVDKPTLLLSVPGRHPLNRDCLIERLDAHYPGVVAVHRLDLATSGVMIIPRHRESLSRLAKAFQDRIVEKTYIARVMGSIHSSVDVSDEIPTSASCAQ